MYINGINLYYVDFLLKMKLNINIDEFYEYRYNCIYVNLILIDFRWKKELFFKKYKRKYFLIFLIFFLDFIYFFIVMGILYIVICFY